MEATVRRQHSTRPISHYWNLVRDMDDSQKLELVSMLIDSVKPAVAAPLLDIPEEEEFPDMDKEFYTPEEAYKWVMKDINAIYGRTDGI